MPNNCTVFIPPEPLVYSIELKKPTTKKDVLEIITLERDALFKRKFGSITPLTETKINNLNKLDSLDPKKDYSIWFTVIERGNPSISAELALTEIPKGTPKFEKHVIMNATFSWQKI